MAENVFVRSESQFGEDVLETAYNSVVAELEALSPDELIQVNLDIMGAVNTAAGVIPELKTMRAQVVDELPKFDVAKVDKLHLYAMAAGYAHTMHLIATGPQDDLRPMFEEAVKLRELLLADATTLIGRGILNGEALKNLKGAIGYQHVQVDLQMLVNLFKANWPAVRGKCGATESELSRGEKLVAWLIEVVGLREQGPAEMAKSADMRIRAFTLFTRTYDDARRAATYLRWKNGDIDDVIPSLYAGRSNGRTGTGKKANETAPAATTGAVGPGEATVVQGGSPTQGQVPVGAPVQSAAGTESALRTGGPFAG